MIEMVGFVFGYRPLDITGDLSWMFSAIGLLSISVLTVFIIDHSGDMHMNRPFLVGVSFLLLESVAVVQGYVCWYTDLWLGTDLVPTSVDFMTYYIPLTAIGVVLSLILSSYLKKRSFVMIKELVVGP